MASDKVGYSTVGKNLRSVKKLKLEDTRGCIDLFPSPDERFKHMDIDITGPLPPCEEYTYLLTCVDRFSR